MPIIIASSVLMIVCLIHVIKTGRTNPWLMVIVFLPLIGSLIYLFMELIPDMMTTRQAHSVKRGLQDVADPNREFGSSFSARGRRPRSVLASELTAFSSRQAGPRLRSEGSKRSAVRWRW